MAIGCYASISTGAVVLPTVTNRRNVKHGDGDVTQLWRLQWVDRQIPFAQRVPIRCGVSRRSRCARQRSRRLAGKLVKHKARWRVQSWSGL